MQPIKKDAKTLEAERDYWFREALVSQEMFAQVLNTVGEPVTVVKGTTLPENVHIQVDENIEDDSFTFYLAEDSEDEEA